MGVIDFEELRLSSGVRGGDVEGLMDIIVERIKDSDESKKDSGFDKARWTTKISTLLASWSQTRSHDLSRSSKF